MATNVFQQIHSGDVFLSSSDVDLGKPWFSALGQVLQESDFAILCLTKDNIRAPWILYEAGAVSKQLDIARIAPLLIGITAQDVPSPLSQFQSAMLNREGVEKLLTSINTQLGANGLAASMLNATFRTWWRKLQPDIALALRHRMISGPRSDYDVFLSAPMAAYADDSAYVASRADVAKLFRAFTVECGMRVYWAGERIEHMSDFDTIDVSVLDDLRALERSRSFVLVYPAKLATSALFEAGYALALKRPSHYFIRHREDLPFLLRELPGSIGSVRIHTSQDWSDYDDLARKICRYKDRWFESVPTARPSAPMTAVRKFSRKRRRHVN